MIFLVNTSVDNHFCCLFDKGGELIDKQEWENRREDGLRLFEFLEKHNDKLGNLTWCGGVSGPGGFTSLRAGAAVINTVSYRFGIPIRAIRADKWVSQYLIENDQKDVPFVLNSFSNSVFVPKNGELDRIVIEEASKKLGEGVFVGVLPPEKQSLFSKPLKLDWKNPEQSLLQVLQGEKDGDHFALDYEFPAV